MTWMARLVIDHVPPPQLAHVVAIAIPAHNEAATIADCLAAIDRSAGRAAPSVVRAVVYVNNSSDSTAVAARNCVVRNFHLTVVETSLEPQASHAGGARRRALDMALVQIDGDGVLLTTDADSRVDENWIASNLSEIESGADAVAGVVTFRDGQSPIVAPARDCEWQLAHLHARLHALLDARQQQRWPTHIWAWGASLAVKAGVYRSVGGLPEVPLAEDRAFVELLDRRGFAVRRSHAPVVYTSFRHDGRAPGGLADLVTSYAADDAAPCDAAIEPTRNLLRRLAWRARLQARYEKFGPSLEESIVRRLALEPREEPTVPQDGFGEWWAAIEEVSPLFSRERVYPHQLEHELGRAARLIALIERAQAHRGGSRRFVVVE